VRSLALSAPLVPSVNAKRLERIGVDGVPVLRGLFNVVSNGGFATASGLTIAQVVKGEVKSVRRDHDHIIVIQDVGRRPGVISNVGCAMKGLAECEG
jgi:hypothetical protein